MTQSLLFNPGFCYDCWDSSIVITPQGLETCARCASAPKSPAAMRLADCVWARVEKKMPVEPEVLNTARILIRATAEQPISNFTLQGYLRAAERDVKNYIRTLRREWVLPIGSTRKSPYGYYWIQTTKEFLDWARPYRAQAIDELVTVYRQQRVNFPELAGQGRLGFVEAIRQEIEEAIQ